MHTESVRKKENFYLPDLVFKGFPTDKMVHTRFLQYTLLMQKTFLVGLCKNDSFKSMWQLMSNGLVNKIFHTL